MTVSMRVMSAGDGYEYLLRTVAAGDGDRSLSTPLTRYYTEEGTLWGREGNSVLFGLILRFQPTDGWRRSSERSEDAQARLVS